MTTPDSQPAPILAPTYDIFLRAGGEMSPRLGDLAAVAPSLGAQSFAQEVMRPRPGFLGLDLAPDVARQVLARLVEVGAVGEVIDAAYRTPQITV